ncbi:peptidyl-prolyl cis-trans isomerase FKBP20-1-like isoform X2 [Miscanthus floridulus]|uniref:peptidyl-prolyl cis-trans isomerase FKBP20-1-like isoform X2 n=1 Tax=Miscanthus floridulus TaxID=154761 RepID=UPI0034575106
MSPNFELLAKIIGCTREHPPVPLLAKVMAETIDLSGDGGVLKTVVRKAKDDAIEPSESLPLVDVPYEGTLAETGGVFNTTHEDNSIFSFEVGQGAVIKAWDIALRTMKVCEVAKITCKSEYAYGAAGSPPEIPPKELKKQRELAAVTKEEEKKKREEAKAGCSSPGTSKA